VDKMPHNFLHLGFIALMFPNAKIIHMNRDPRDTALSNFQQNFRAKHGMLGYSVNLEWTAQHINDYHRLMQHWRQVLPIPIFDLSYEALVQDQENTTARLLEFIGVPWEDSVIDFHKTERAVRTASVTQVRQKIYATSQKKWKKYEDHLAPLLENLNPEVTEPWDNPTEDNNPYESKIVHQGEVKRFSRNEVA
ncbi:MAG: sulfotransferase family protein, partial [Thermodesulfobacteriota bacterium]